MTTRQFPLVSTERGHPCFLGSFGAVACHARQRLFCADNPSEHIKKPLSRPRPRRRRRRRTSRRERASATPRTSTRRGRGRSRPTTRAHHRTNSRPLCQSPAHRHVVVRQVRRGHTNSREKITSQASPSSWTSSRPPSSSTKPQRARSAASFVATGGSPAPFRNTTRAPRRAPSAQRRPVPRRRRTLVRRGPKEIAASRGSNAGLKVIRSGCGDARLGRSGRVPSSCWLSNSKVRGDEVDFWIFRKRNGSSTLLKEDLLRSKILSKI